MTRADAGVLTFAGLFGALGVAAAAAAAHRAEPMLDTASAMLLAHAPALLGLAAARAAGLAPRRPSGRPAPGAPGRPTPQADRASGPSTLAYPGVPPPRGGDTWQRPR